MGLLFPLVLPHHKSHLKTALVRGTYQEVHNKFIKEDNSDTANPHLEFHVNSLHVSEVATTSCSIVDNNLEIINIVHC